jgi:hypothetical protein
MSSIELQRKFDTEKIRQQRLFRSRLSDGYRCAQWGLIHL